MIAGNQFHYTNEQALHSSPSLSLKGVCDRTVLRLGASGGRLGAPGTCVTSASHNKLHGAVMFIDCREILRLDVDMCGRVRSYCAFLA